MAFNSPDRVPKLASLRTATTVAHVLGSRNPSFPPSHVLNTVVQACSTWKLVSLRIVPIVFPSKWSRVAIFSHLAAELEIICIVLPLYSIRSSSWFLGISFLFGRELELPAPVGGWRERMCIGNYWHIELCGDNMKRGIQLCVKLCMCRVHCILSEVHVDIQ